MGLQVIAEKSRAGATGAKVVVEARAPKLVDAYELVSSNDAKNMAIEWAAQNGCSRGGLGVPSAVFPVKEDGSPCAEASAQNAVGYRTEYEVNGG